MGSKKQSKRKKAESEDEEVADDAVVNNGVDHVESKWAVDDYRQLLRQVKQQLHDDDRLTVMKRIKRMKWDKINVPGHEPAECKAQIHKISTQALKRLSLPDLFPSLERYIENPINLAPDKKVHPDFPKKPLTPYMRFSHDMYAKLKGKHPNLTMLEITGKISKRWKLLTDTKKAEWVEPYSIEKVKYDKAKGEFYRSHREYKVLPNVRKMKKGANALEPPRSPMDHYIAGKLDPNLEKEERDAAIERLRAEWEKRKPKRKIKYIEVALEDEERYQNELAEYKMKHPDDKSKRLPHKVSQADREIVDKFYGRPKPPRGNNAYTLFSAELKSEGGVEHGRKHFEDALTKWNALSREEKEDYKRRLKQERDWYQRECEEYLEKIEDEERREKERKLLNSRMPMDLQESKGKKKKIEKTQAKATPGRILFRMEQENALRENEPALSEEERKERITEMYLALDDKEKKALEQRAKGMSF